MTDNKDNESNQNPEKGSKGGSGNRLPLPEPPPRDRKTIEKLRTYIKKHQLIIVFLLISLGIFAYFLFFAPKKEKEIVKKNPKKREEPKPQKQDNQDTIRRIDTDTSKVIEQKDSQEDNNILPKEEHTPIIIPEEVPTQEFLAQREEYINYYERKINAQSRSTEEVGILSPQNFVQYQTVKFEIKYKPSQELKVELRDSLSAHKMYDTRDLNTVEGDVSSTNISDLPKGTYYWKLIDAKNDDDVLHYGKFYVK